MEKNQLPNQNPPNQSNQPNQPNQPNPSAFPHESVTLPSKGYFYSPTDPLSSGELELRYPSAKDEDILTSTNLIKKKTVLDVLLKSVVISPVNLDNLLLGDKNSLFINIRIMMYGSKYQCNVTCPSCQETNQKTIDISEFGFKSVDFAKYDKGKNNFEFKLPKVKKVINFKIITQAEEKLINSELKTAKIASGGMEREITTRLKHAIVSIDGSDDRREIAKFVDSDQFVIPDVEALRTEISKVSPDVDMKFDFECELCDHMERMVMPMGISFFWPDRER